MGVLLWEDISGQFERTWVSYIPEGDQKSGLTPFGLTTQKQKERANMPTDPAILAQLQTLWGEPVTEATSEADGEAAFVPCEWQPSPIPPTRSADTSATWDADAAELIGWFQANRDRLPVELFCLWPGAWVVDAALFYRSLDGDIATGPDGPRSRYGGLVHDLKCLRRVVRD